MINKSGSPACKTTKWRRLTLVGIALGGVLILLFFARVWYLRGLGDPVPPERQFESDFKSFESALAMYRLTAGQYPTTEQGLEALEKKPETGPKPRRWSQIMFRLPKDPWGNSYRYQFPAPGDPEKPLISSNGPDGHAGTGDDLSRSGE